MVVGIGVDIVDVSQFTEVQGRYAGAFVRRVFTPDEVADCGTGPRRIRRLAARFAAKEAALKALGIGLSGAGLVEIEVVTVAPGSYCLRLHGRAAARAQQLGVGRLLLSLSDCPRYATAQVIAEQG